MPDKKIFKYLHTSDPYHVKIYDTEVAYNKLPRFFGTMENAPFMTKQMELAEWTEHETEKLMIDKQEKIIIAYADVTDDPSKSTDVDNIAANLVFARNEFVKKLNELELKNANTNNPADDLTWQKKVISEIINDKYSSFYDILKKLNEISDMKCLSAGQPLHKDVLNIIDEYIARIEDYV